MRTEKQLIAYIKDHTKEAEKAEKELEELEEQG